MGSDELQNNLVLSFLPMYFRGFEENGIICSSLFLDLSWFDFISVFQIYASLTLIDRKYELV